MNKDMREQALRERRIFAIDNSFHFAVQVPDDSVGISGSRCSNCENVVAYCDQRCTSCGLPFIGPVGFPQFSEWKDLSANRKRITVEDVYARDNTRGRLGYANVEFVPLTPNELNEIEKLAGDAVEHFISVHGISPQKIRHTLF